MAMLCLGVIIGFLISPIKKGVRVSIGSNNQNSRLMNQGDDLDDWYDDDLYDYEDYDGDTIYEKIEDDDEEPKEERDLPYEDEDGIVHF